MRAVLRSIDPCALSSLPAANMAALAAAAAPQAAAAAPALGSQSHSQQESVAMRRASLINLEGISPPRERCLSVSGSNALENFSVLEDLLKSRRLVLLLDYDGTLTPIVNDPSKALLSESVSQSSCTGSKLGS